MRQMGRQALKLWSLSLHPHSVRPGQEPRALASHTPDCLRDVVHILRLDDGLQVIFK